MTESPDKPTYASSGVDISAADRALDLFKPHIRSTLRPEVLGAMGFFGGLFELKGHRNPVLVSSADGVGTKLKIASALGRHDTIGIDLVNHCVNDILTCGAEPLFFLDYIGVGRLVPEQVADVVKGLAEACKSVGCALIGGETAEMPGVYGETDYDLVGFIVGVVEKDRIIDGGSLAPGDAVIGLPSNGLHTNGYSLVRKVFGENPAVLNTFNVDLRCTLGDELLRPHRCYFHDLKPVMAKVKGLAHITGGGLPGNIPRLFRGELSARIRKGAWQVPPIFRMIQRQGGIDEQEMYHVFNMGIGMAVFCAASETDAMLSSLPGAMVIGEVVEGDGSVMLE